MIANWEFNLLTYRFNYFYRLAISHNLLNRDCALLDKIRTFNMINIKELEN